MHEFLRKEQQQEIFAFRFFHDRPICPPQPYPRCSSNSVVNSQRFSQRTWSAVSGTARIQFYFKVRRKFSVASNSSGFHVNNKFILLNIVSLKEPMSLDIHSLNPRWLGCISAI
jgi:hypothetical protein